MGRHQRGGSRLRLDDLNDTSDHPPLRLSEAVKASIGRRKRELQADEASMQILVEDRVVSPKLAGVSHLNKHLSRCKAGRISDLEKKERQWWP